VLTPRQLLKRVELAAREGRWVRLEKIINFWSSGLPAIIGVLRVLNPALLALNGWSVIVWGNYNWLSWTALTAIAMSTYAIWLPYPQLKETTHRLRDFGLRLGHHTFSMHVYNRTLFPRCSHLHFSEIRHGSVAQFVFFVLLHPWQVTTKVSRTTKRASQ